MSDARLRQLERRAATGGIEARAALLRAQVRAAEIPRERLQLASMLGDPASRIACSRCATCGCLPFRGYPCRCHLKCSRRCKCIGCNLRTWLQWLGDEADAQALVRMAIAATRAALLLPATITAGSGTWVGPVPTFHLAGLERARAVEAAEAWVLCPCLAHARACLPEKHGVRRGDSTPFYYLLMCVGSAQHDWSTLAEEMRNTVWELVVRLGVGSIRQVIRDALVPWLLGESDPILEQTLPRRVTTIDANEWLSRYEGHPDGDALRKQFHEITQVEERRGTSAHRITDHLDEGLWHERRWVAPDYRRPA